MGAGASAHEQNSFTGDFYQESQDVVRGVSLAQPVEVFPVGERDGKDCPGGFEEYDVPQRFCLADAACCVSADHACVDPFQKFSEACLPPRLPVDPFFTLSATTVHVECARPSEIGNCLIDFFDEMRTTSLVKLNQKKFSLKAEVLIDNVPCTVKVRIFQTAQRSFGVEFRRKRGDIWSFGNCYQLAVRFLQQGFPDGIVPRASEATLLEDSLRRTPPPIAADGSNMQPLLDMAGNSCLPAMQAESACALAAIAESGGLPASSLCTDCAFDQFQVLLKTDTLDVLYPTARMLTFLAALPGVALMFASQGLLPIMLDRVGAPVCELRLQQQFAQALCTAILQCTGLLSEQLFRDVSSGLADILKAKELEKNGQLCQSLQKAYSALAPQATSPAVA